MSQTFSLQKSRALLKEQGYDTWIVEKPFNPYTKRREDLFNFIDVVALRDDIVGVTGIQACGEDVQTHIQKLLSGYVDAKGKRIEPNPHIATWLKTSNRFFIWGWALRGSRGTRKTYRLREVEFVLKDGQVIAQEILHETA